MSTMDDQIALLLLRWEESWEQGQDLTAEELCADCPDLVDPLQAKINILKKMAWMNVETSENTGSSENNDGLSPHVGKTKSKRYRIDQLIGEGGFGQVYRAYDAKLHREVAIKIAHRQTKAYNKNLLQEARRVAQLQHPGIVAVHDVDHDGNIVFIVSDFIDGENLAQRIQSQPIEPREAVKLVTAIAEALHYAHQQGFVHRDIKPANILIDKQGRPLITDFGIAATEKELGDSRSATSGTLPYMAPEQLAGEVHLIDARTDVYALGVVLYELLTGKLPFRGRTPTALREQILFKTPEPIQTENQEVPQYLEAVCHACLSKHPSHRPKSAADLAASLRSCFQTQQPRQTPKIPGRLIALPVVLIAIVLVFFLVRNSLFSEDATSKSTINEPRKDDPKTGLSPEPSNASSLHTPREALPANRHTREPQGQFQVWEWTGAHKFKLWLHANGLVSKETETPSDPKHRWVRSGNMLIVYWPQGWIDSMTMHPDGKTMSGHNQKQRKITARLIQGHPGFLDRSDPESTHGSSDASDDAPTHVSGQTGDMGTSNQRKTTTAGTQKPPQVVSMEPPNGATDVDPNLQEICVTFDQPMDGNFSWTCSKRDMSHFPKGRKGEKLRWTNDGKTCIRPVTLKPGWDYRYGLNSPSHKGFKSKSGVPLEPVACSFRTRGQPFTAEPSSSTISHAPPRIVSMEPPNGATNVDPNLKEIRIVFDQPMGGGYSWTTWGSDKAHVPRGREGMKPRWLNDRKTYVFPTQLKPGWDYRVSLNCPGHENFKSRKGVSLIPFVYTFHTRDTSLPARKLGDLTSGLVMALSFEPDRPKVSRPSGTGRNISSAAGMVGRCLDVSRPKSYFEIEKNFSPRSEPRSLSVWLKSSRGPVQHNIHVLTYGNNGKNRPFGIMQAGGKWRFYDNNGGLDTRQTIDQRWHHHCITYNGRSLKYYIDNRLVATESKQLNTGYGSLVLGATTEKKNYFSGMIDELAFFDRALSPEEVKTLYKMGLEEQSVDSLQE